MSSLDPSRLAALEKWTRGRTRIKKLEEDLREERERLKKLERENPFLGNVKGMLAPKPKKRAAPTQTSPTDPKSDSATGPGGTAKKRKGPESHPGGAPDPKKIEDIKKIAAPRSVTELRSFLGMVMYYAKFVNNISTILAPLYQLLRKNVAFEWSEDCNQAFNKVKEMLISSEVLAHYDPALPLVLTTDASSVGVGAVISHLTPGGGGSGSGGGGGGERPIAYASRVLNSAEKVYSQIEKEALAIIYGIKKFHQYLYGRKFILRIDHKPLVTIFGEKIGIPVMAASRMQRWAILLSRYQYDIEYIPTSRNGADALSRLPPEGTTRSQGKEISYLNFVQDFLPITSEQIRHETERDPTLRRLTMFIRDGWPNTCENEQFQPFYNRRHELYIDNGCVMWGYRIVVPQSIKHLVLKELHVGHLGIVKMKSLARSYVWWAGIDADIERCCRECVVCAAEAAAPPRAPPQPWPYHTEPWSRLHMDFLGPFEGKTFFILIDATSKWIEAFLMTTTTASAVTKTLRQTFARFGLPKEMVSDNGPPFSSKEMDDFMKSNGIKHLFTPAYHPSSNGAAEGAVKLCKRAIKKAAREKVDVETALQTYLMSYRNSEHSTTGQTPAMMLQRRPLRSRLDLLHSRRAIEDKVQEAQRKQIRDAKGVNRDQFVPGDQVWSKEFRSGEKWVPGTVAKVLGSRNYIVDRGNGEAVKRHMDQLKKKSVFGYPTEVSEEERASHENSITQPANTSIPEAREDPAFEPQNAPAPEPHLAPRPPQCTQSLPETSQTRPKRIRTVPSRYGFEID